MKNNKVLVLGGSYFIGKKIVELLLAAGYDVTTLNRGSKKCPFQKVNTIICDRNDKEAMQIALKDKVFDVVIDVSGLTANSLTIATDILVTPALKKYIFISSSAVYAVNKSRPPYHVGDTMGYNEYWTDYGTNKCDAEMVLFTKFSGKAASKLVIIRPPYVYGEDNYVQRESFIFEHLINNKPIFIPGAGDTKIQFIYVTDLARIVLFFIQEKLSKLGIFNVGNKEAITFNKWVSLCANAAGITANTYHLDYKKHNYEVRAFFPFHNYINVLALDLIEELYNEPETPMLEGLKNAFEWYKQNADTITFKQDIAENEKNIINKLNVPLI